MHENSPSKVELSPLHWGVTYAYIIVIHYSAIDMKINRHFIKIFLSLNIIVTVINRVATLN